MRSHQLALLGAAALASSASADTEPQTFVPTTLSGPFLEQFNDSWEKRWVASSATKAAPVGASGETFTYVGVWSVEEPTVFPGIPGDKGLVVKSKAAHHAISAEIQPAVKIEEGKPLVVQYETKLQKGLECGGAYVKLLSEGEGDLSANEFSDKTPFTIMFGPDKCGSTNKVHFIFRHLNPKTGVYEEKHLSATPSPMITKTTALYTLIVNPDNTYEILINDESAKKGSLLEDFTPAVNPPAEIDDASDFKPADWVDEAFIVDPEAVKPEDWDESAPRTVVDTEATMPDGWLEDEPDVIPDPDAEKPEEWDDEEDGDWIAPVVSNPKCEDAPGCGPWSQPSIPNPAYKGIWSAPKITNPAYLGVWAPRKIPNPDFFEDKDVAKGLTAIGGVGFEIWTMTEDVLFDNVYVGHSVEDAKKLAEETFHVKNKLEREAEKVALGADEEDDDAATKPFYEEYLKIAKERVPLFVELVKENPVEAIKAMPEVAGGLVAALLLPLTLAFALLTFLSAPAPAAAAAATPKKTAPATTTTAKKLAVPAPETDETIAGADKADVDSGLRERKGKGREL